MTERTTAFTILRDHFEKVGWPMDVDEQKFSKMASIESGDDSASKVIVNIERHRSILGGGYTKGLPMKAFETYYMCYEVDVRDRSVRELDESKGVAEIDIDGLVAQDLSWDNLELVIEPVENGCYEVSDKVSGHRKTVSSLDETRAFMAEIGEGFVNFFMLKLEADDAAATDQSELQTMYTVAIQGALSAKADELWSRRDDDSTY